MLLWGVESKQARKRRLQRARQPKHAARRKERYHAEPAFREQVCAWSRAWWKKQKEEVPR